MSSYRRNLVPGASYFFTVNLADRGSRLLTDGIDVLRAAFLHALNQNSFRIEAIVILPEHLHAIWTLPPGDADFSTRWRLIKGTFSRALAPGERHSQSRRSKAERGIWQRRFWEHTLRDDRDFERHCDYIHFNPVKHGYVASARDWPYSSFHRFVRRGVLDADWALEDVAHLGEFGER